MCVCVCEGLDIPIIILTGFLFHSPIFQMEYHHVSQFSVRRTCGALVFLFLVLRLDTCLFVIGAPALEARVH